VDKDHTEAADELLADYADSSIQTDEDSFVYLPDGDLKIDRPIKGRAGHTWLPFALKTERVNPPRICEYCTIFEDHPQVGEPCKGTPQEWEYEGEGW
jgi:hypothetical protein